MNFLRQLLTAEDSLLQIEASSTIHARAVRGRHMRWRWAIVWLTQLVFYGLPWLQVDGQPALWFDLNGLRFFVLGAVLFPQDLVWLATLLIACALLLFFATSLLGRVWCGFACPQTVYTALFTWIEHRCEGDRRARELLDNSGWNLHKVTRRGAKQALWLLASLWTGATLVGYFTPIRTLMANIPQGLGAWESFWILFYGLATYGNAGFLREKVCLHMCPYGRFQGSLMDRHTLNVSYDTHRGEPRGGRSRQADAKAMGLGACVDCTLCIQVCPTGVDIRKGLQAGCINCGLCIDACDTVMDKIEQPRGLIRFASQQELASRVPANSVRPLGLRVLKQLRRPRVALYATLLVAIGVSLIHGVITHPQLRLNSMRDRSVMSRVVERGAVENLYQLLLVNASNEERLISLSVLSNKLDGLTLEPAEPVVLLPAQTHTVLVRVRIPGEQVREHPGQTVPVTFLASSIHDAGFTKAQSPSTFMIPR